MKIETTNYNSLLASLNSLSNTRFILINTILKES